jgi:AAA family ATP:ADP antiporter
LAAAFFCVIGSYTVTKELKNTIFAYVVGREYIPWVKTLSMFLLIPAIFAYSKLVDKMRRYWLLVSYSILYAVMGCCFAYYVGHPEIGLANTDPSPYRLFGWIFYCVVEGFSPFVVSVFWAFANSISSPDAAKKNYGWMVSGSKLGGMASISFAWLWLTMRPMGLEFHTDVVNHQVLLLSSSLMLFGVAPIILLMMRYVPGKFLHGYEAAYKVEKQKARQGKEETGIFAGLIMLVRYPYVMGIFGMAFFYEVSGAVLSYMSITVAQTTSATMSDALKYMLEIKFYMHFMGFLIAAIGTGPLFRWLGVKRCLMLVPLSAAVIFIYYLANAQSSTALLITFVTLQAINYAFSWPLRESLYIPTVKEIKFKSKSWIDAFGSKFAKSTGSSFNLVAELFGGELFFAVHSAFFGIIILCWVATAYLLGKRFDQAVQNNEVIGQEE